MSPLEQKDIAATIIERGADYIFALKGSQSSLFEDVQWLFEQAQAVQFQDVAHDFAQTIDKGHGRIEIRRCWTLAEAELDYLVQKPQWKCLKRVVMLQSERRINGQTSTETRYYISSLDSDAAKILTAIRAHWTVENYLHWVLDVAFDEDACRIRKDYAPKTSHYSVTLHSTYSDKTKRQRQALQPNAKRRAGMMPICSGSCLNNFHAFTLRDSSFKISSNKSRIQSSLFS
ncbi:ISAs1 family transposase [Cyanobacteria bacterium FACHB-63]|nr:ISAs1 family transposase [Cyanobacteria bacterium FACHB-63]